MCVAVACLVVILIHLGAGRVSNVLKMGNASQLFSDRGERVECANITRLTGIPLTEAGFEELVDAITFFGETILTVASIQVPFAGQRSKV